MTGQRRRLVRVATIGLAAAFLWRVPLAATVLVPSDFSTMVSESQVIVHGRIVDVRGQLVNDRRTIVSLVTVAVSDAVKGPALAQVTFRVPGGQVGRYRRVMVGAPTFEPGDEIVLFLKGNAPVMPAPFGLNQGVYRVSRGGGAAMVMPPTEATGRIVRGDPARRPIALQEFIRQVRATAQVAR